VTRGSLRNANDLSSLSSVWHCILLAPRGAFSLQVNPHLSTSADHSAVESSVEASGDKDAAHNPAAIHCESLGIVSNKAEGVFGGDRITDILNDPAGLGLHSSGHDHPNLLTCHVKKRPSRIARIQRGLKLD